MSCLPPSLQLWYKVSIFSTVKSPFSCPVIENFVWIEPLLRGHLSYKATFYLSHRWLLNTGLTVNATLKGLIVYFQFQLILMIFFFMLLIKFVFQVQIRFDQASSYGFRDKRVQMGSKGTNIQNHNFLILNFVHLIPVWAIPTDLE